MPSQLELTQPRSPGWAQFTITMECAPESGHCQAIVLSRLWTRVPSLDVGLLASTRWPKGGWEDNVYNYVN
jgi:hypothetical protein